VTTSAASNPATTSATLNGNLADLGTATTVNVSFEWGTDTSYAGGTTTAVAKDAIGTFSASLTSLTAKTTYHFRAKAAGHGLPVYGSDMTFTTSTIPPAVTTDNASSVATTSATLNGNLTAMGTTADNVTVSFEYGTTSGGSYTAIAAGSKASTGTFSVNLSGLTPGATYYFRAVADGDGDPVYGLENSFTTSTTPPTVTTDNATNVLAASARLNGNLTSLGTAGTVTVSFVWGTTAGGPYPSLTDNQTLTSSGAFSANLSGLGAMKTYFYKAKVVVNGGTPIYGTEKTFTTIDTTAPVITVVSSSDFTVSGATITWSTNEAATTQVRYGLTEEYGSVTPEVTSLVTSHSVNLTGLKAGKTYHYQVISKDAANNQAVSADATFKTAASSGGMPAWAWVLIGLAAVGVAGAAAFLIRGKLAQK
jgi:subtilisin